MQIPIDPNRSLLLLLLIISPKPVRQIKSSKGQITLKKSHNFCGNPFVFLRNLWNSLKILLFYWKSRTLLGGVIRVKIQDEIQVQILPLLLGGTLKVNKSMLSDWQCIIYESLSYTLTSLHLQNPLRPHSMIQWMLACKTIYGSLF